MSATIKTVLWLLLLSFVGLSIAVCIRFWPGPKQPVVYELIYKIDPDDPASNRYKIPMDDLVNAIERRLNPPGNRRAAINASNDNLIHVGLFDDSADAVRIAKYLLERKGTLEFRILANEKDHANWIKRAQATKGNYVYAEDDPRGLKTGAKWAPLVPGALPESTDSSTAVTRNSPRGHTEVLVITDPFNVSSDFIQDAAVSIDKITNQRCIDLRFDQRGADCFAHLTGTNLPRPDGTVRQLAIILDGWVQATPAIRSTIHRDAQINGNFTNEEATNLADILRTGPLPAWLNLVSEGPVNSDHSAEK